VPELNDAKPHARAEMHPTTAASLGVADGDLVELSNRRGSVRARALVAATIRPDTVFLPFHFAGTECANLLTQDATDPVSGMPEFKTTAVSVRAVREEVTA